MSTAESWKENFRLGDICRIRHGFTCKGEWMTREDEPGLPIVVNIGNFDYHGGFRFEQTRVQRYKGDFPEKYRLKPGDVLVIMTCQTPEGEILGIPGRIPDDGNTYLHNQRLGLAEITDPARLDGEFLYWLFLSPQFNQYLVASATGAKILHTSPARIEDYRFLLPPLPIQREIAAILQAYEELIRINVKRVRILEEMAELTYREWFVHFLFPSFGQTKFVSSPMGLIPEDWQVAALTNIAQVYSGGTPKTTKAKYWNGPIPFFTPRDVPDSMYTFETEKSISAEGLDSCTSKLFPKHTIFLTARGTVGKLAMNGVEMAMNQSCYALRGYHETNQFFLYLTLKNHIDTIKQCAHGAIFDTIVADTLRSLSVVLPPSGLVFRFGTLVAPFFYQIMELERQNIVLRKTIMLILPELFRGQWRRYSEDLELSQNFF